MRARRFGEAFTLVELLVVIAIIGVLAGLLASGIMGARRAAKFTVARNDVQQLKLAIATYTTDFGYPPPDDMWTMEDRINTSDDARAAYAASHPISPNECLVYYLGTEFRPNVTEGQARVDGLGGKVENGPPMTGFINKKAVAYSPEQRGPYIEFNRNQLQVWPPNRPFKNLMDPWELPYFYNATGGEYGNSQHNAIFDFFSVGPNGLTAQTATNVRQQFDAFATGPLVDTARFVEFRNWWTGILTNYKSGNDVDTGKGGNPYTDTYGPDKVDDVPNW